MENLKNYQQHFFFYHSPKKMFLKITSKMYWLTFPY